MTDAERLDLKDQILMADLLLKTRQGVWETPRKIAIIVAASVGIAGVLGFKLGQKEPLPPAPPQIIFQPGSIVVQPAPPK